MVQDPLRHTSEQQTVDEVFPVRRDHEEYNQHRALMDERIPSMPPGGNSPGKAPDEVEVPL